MYSNTKLVFICVIFCASHISLIFSENTTGSDISNTISSISILSTKSSDTKKPLDKKTSSNQTINLTTKTLDIKTSSSQTKSSTTKTLDIKASDWTSSQTKNSTTKPEDIKTSSSQTKNLTTKPVDITTSTSQTKNLTTKTLHIKTSSSQTKNLTTKLVDITSSSQTKNLTTKPVDIKTSTSQTKNLTTKPNDTTLTLVTFEMSSVFELTHTTESSSTKLNDAVISKITERSFDLTTKSTDKETADTLPLSTKLNETTNSIDININTTKNDTNEKITTKLNVITTPGLTKKTNSIVNSLTTLNDVTRSTTYNTTKKIDDLFKPLTDVTKSIVMKSNENFNIKNSSTKINNVLKSKTTKMTTNKPSKTNDMNSTMIINDILNSKTTKGTTNKRKKLSEKLNDGAHSTTPIPYNSSTTKSHLNINEIRKNLLAKIKNNDEKNKEDNLVELDSWDSLFDDISERSLSLGTKNYSMNVTDDALALKILKELNKNIKNKEKANLRNKNSVIYDIKIHVYNNTFNNYGTDNLKNNLEKLIKNIIEQKQVTMKSHKNPSKGLFQKNNITSKFPDKNKYYAYNESTTKIKTNNTKSNHPEQRTILKEFLYNNEENKTDIKTNTITKIKISNDKNDTKLSDNLKNSTKGETTAVALNETINSSTTENILDQVSNDRDMNDNFIKNISQRNYNIAANNSLTQIDSMNGSNIIAENITQRNLGNYNDCDDGQPRSMTDCNIKSRNNIQRNNEYTYLNSQQIQKPSKSDFHENATPQKNIQNSKNDFQKVNGDIQQYNTSNRGMDYMIKPFLNNDVTADKLEIFKKLTFETNNFQKQTVKPNYLIPNSYYKQHFLKSYFLQQKKPDKLLFQPYLLVPQENKYPRNNIFNENKNLTKNNFGVMKGKYKKDQQVYNTKHENFNQLKGNGNNFNSSNKFNNNHSLLRKCFENYLENRFISNNNNNNNTDLLNSNNTFLDNLIPLIYGLDNCSHLMKIINDVDKEIKKFININDTINSINCLNEKGVFTCKVIFTKN